MTLTQRDVLLIARHAAGLSRRRHQTHALLQRAPRVSAAWDAPITGITNSGHGVALAFDVSRLVLGRRWSYRVRGPASIALMSALCGARPPTSPRTITQNVCVIAFGSWDCAASLWDTPCATWCGCRNHTSWLDDLRLNGTAHFISYQVFEVRGPSIGGWPRRRTLFLKRQPQLCQAKRNRDFPQRL